VSGARVVDDTLLAWPKPESLGDDLLPVPAFDVAMLPEAFRDHVIDVAERMQVPVDLPAVYAVACLAGCVNRRAAFQPKRADTGWIVTPNLWACIVAPPGQMKTPTQAAFTQHIARLENCGAADLLRFLSAGEAERQAAIARVLARGGVYDSLQRFVEVC
jgi:hypothetical protein